MIRLIMFPQFDYKRGVKEAGEYLITYSRGPTKEDFHSTVVLSMNCSCLRWAIQDAEYELKNCFDALFGKDNWEVLFTDKPSKDYFFQESEHNDIIVNYGLKRRQYKLPPWCDTDIYQYGG